MNINLDLISPYDCPRKYCYFWVSIDFSWELTPIQGCTYLQGRLPPVPTAKLPCCRCDPNSPFDHFEPLEDIAQADQVDYNIWLKLALDRNRLYFENKINKAT